MRERARGSGCASLQASDSCDPQCAPWPPSERHNKLSVSPGQSPQPIGYIGKRKGYCLLRATHVTTELPVCPTASKCPNCAVRDSTCTCSFPSSLHESLQAHPPSLSASSKPVSAALHGSMHPACPPADTPAIMALSCKCSYLSASCLHWSLIESGPSLFGLVAASTRVVLHLFDCGQLLFGRPRSALCSHIYIARTALPSNQS